MIEQWNHVDGMHTAGRHTAQQLTLPAGQLASGVTGDEDDARVPLLKGLAELGGLQRLVDEGVKQAVRIIGRGGRRRGVQGHSGAGSEGAGDVVQHQHHRASTCLARLPQLAAGAEEELQQGVVLGLGPGGVQVLDAVAVFLGAVLLRRVCGAVADGVRHGLGCGIKRAAASQVHIDDVRIGGVLGVGARCPALAKALQTKRVRSQPVQVQDNKREVSALQSARCTPAGKLPATLCSPSAPEPRRAWWCPSPRA